MSGVIADVARDCFDVFGVEVLDVAASVKDFVGCAGGFGGGPGCAVEVLFVLGERKPGVAADCGVFFD